MKKATGIVRKIDELGRIVLPIELRRSLEIPDGAPLEIYVNDDEIILRKYTMSCTFCGNNEDLKIILNRPVCSDCLDKLLKDDR
jgi:transcriptional pleiotropic regulator of transition state genes